MLITILSGDLNGNDGPNFTNNAENCYYVLTGSGTDETDILDGFTITGGNSNTLRPYHAGGGIYNQTGRGRFSFGPKIDSALNISATELGDWGGFHGALDEIRLYNNALSPTNIKTLADQ